MAVGPEELNKMREAFEAEQKKCREAEEHARLAEEQARLEEERRKEATTGQAQGNIRNSK